MISKISKREYRAVIAACSFFNLIPYALDKNPRKQYEKMDGVFLKISPRIGWYKAYFKFNSLVMTVTFLMFSYQIYKEEMSMAIALSMCGFLAIVIIAAGAQVFLYFGYETLLPALNSFYVFQYRLAKMYKVKSSKDGLEKLLPLMNLAAAGVAFLIFPANLFLLESNHPAVRNLVASKYLAVNIMHSINTAIVAQANTAALLFMIYLTVLDLNSTQWWMQYLKWKPESIKKDRIRNRIAYRYLQVSNRLATNNTRSAAAFLYFVNIVIQIMLIFFVIRLYDTLPLFCGAGFSVLIMCMFMTEFCIRVSLAIETSSIECSESFLRNDFSLNALDRAFFKSCKPLRIEVGKFFTVTGSNFYLELYQGIIVAYVTDLLISY